MIEATPNISGCIYNIDSENGKNFKNIRELIRILKNKKVYGNKHKIST